MLEARGTNNALSGFTDVKPGRLREPRPAYDPIGTIEAFAQVIEAGTVSDMTLLLSPHFLDEDGRDREELLSEIKRLIGDTALRRFRILKAEETRRSVRDAGFKLIVTWHAEFSGEKQAAISEEFILEVLLDKEDDVWRIVALKSARI